MSTYYRKDLSKELKLTPPSPQHPQRRLTFFLKHPELPSATEEIKRLKERLNYKEPEVVKEIPVTVKKEIKPSVAMGADHIELASKSKKQSLFNRIINKFKKEK